MTIHASAQSLTHLHTVIWAETTARPWMRCVRVSAGKQCGQWVADIEMENV